MDKYETEIENEGITNFPHTENKPLKFFYNTKINSSIMKINSLIPDDLSDFPILTEDFFNSEDKFNLIQSIPENKLNIKNDDINSATTKISVGSNEEKIKKVTFSIVEIIRVENYKKYNKLNIFKKNDNNNTTSDNECRLF